ncbi:hypothetical protein GP486_007792, partial [Trichoglossum hirsutum]
LINELEEARKELEKEPKKRKFGFFGRGKEVGKKQEWETYDDATKDGISEGNSKNGTPNTDGNVLFDVDAIRAELANQQIEIKQLESTLPPMKLDLSAANDRLNTQSPHPTLRQSKSYDAGLAPQTLDRSPATVKAKTPPIPQKGGFQEYDEHDDLPADSGGSEHIQMTFEPARRSPSPPAMHLKGASISDPEPAKGNVTLERPALNNPSATAPAFLGDALEHNAWLDEDDHEFGTEKEVTMSFE